MRADALEEPARAHRARAVQPRQGSHRQFRDGRPFAFFCRCLVHEFGAKVIEVPFGEGQAIVNLLGGRIEGVVQLPAALVPHVRNGDLRVLAVLGSARDPVFAEASTERSSDMTYVLTCGGVLPCLRARPRPIIISLQGAVEKTVHSQSFDDAGKALGFTPAYLSAEEFGMLIASDDAKLAQLMADLGLKK